MTRVGYAYLRSSFRVPDWQRRNGYLSRERVTLFFEANAIDANTRVSAILSSVGGSIYALLRNLLAPKKTAGTAVLGAFKVLKDHFKPEPLVIAECFHFYRREQQPTESIQEYVAELHRLAIHCAFNANLDVKHFMTVWCVA